MAITPSVFLRTSTTSATYSPPSTGIITNIVVSNSSGTSATATITVSGIPVLGTVSVAANTTAFFDIKQVVNAASTIAVSSSATLNFHISGVLYV